MKKSSYKNFPDKNGNFGQYGGRYVAETLMPLILDLEKKIFILHGIFWNRWYSITYGNTLSYLFNILGKTS